jgi:hypothetical protein
MTTATTIRSRRPSSAARRGRDRIRPVRSSTGPRTVEPRSSRCHEGRAIWPGRFWPHRTSALDLQPPEAAARRWVLRRRRRGSVVCTSSPTARPGGCSDCSSGDARRDLLLLLVGRQARGRAWPNPAEAVLDYGCLEASKDAALAGSRVSLDVVDEDVHQYGGGVSVSAALIGRPELLELARGSSRPQGLMWTTSAVQLPIRGSRAAQNCVWWASSLSVPVDTAS